MMAVASKLPHAALLALSLTACSGNVLEGLPYDGGQEVVEQEPQQSGELEDAGETAPRRDASAPPANNNRDASTPTPSQPDASKPAGGNDAGMPAPAADAGAPGTALNGGPLARSVTGREFSADQAKWGGSPRCNEQLATFCDDFESQVAGGGVGPAWTFNGTAATTSEEQKMRGAKSMRFQVPSGMPGQIQETKTAATLKTAMFGRLFVYFNGLPTAPNDALWTLVEVSGAGTNAQVRIGGRFDPARNGKHYWGVGSDGGDETGDWHTTGLEPEALIKEKTWTCVEWMFKGDSDETRVWINNVELLSLHTTGANFRAGDQEGGKTFVHPSYDRVKVGWWVYQPAATPSPTTIFIDELIVDDEPVGCSL